MADKLSQEHAELLPEREALGYGGVNVAKIWASNTAVAANVNSDYSTAKAAAIQVIKVDQD